MKGMESVLDHIRREFAKTRCMNARREAEVAVNELLEAPETPPRPTIRPVITLDVRAESICKKVPRVLTHRREHEGPWQVNAPDVRDENELDALFSEALRSLGYRK